MKKIQTPLNSITIQHEELSPTITSTYYKDGAHNFLFAPQYRKICIMEISYEEDTGSSNMDQRRDRD